MRNLVALFLLLVGCGSDRVVYVYPEMSAPDDLSASVPSDFAAPLDLFTPCTAPQADVYGESNNFTYASPANPNPTAGGNGLTVVVRNSGAIERPADNMSVPYFFHCDTPPVIDAQSCLAPCCAGDPTVVPSVYYFGKGWRLFKAGTCTIKDPTSAVVYTVQFTNIVGSPQ